MDLIQLFSKKSVTSNPFLPVIKNNNGEFFSQIVENEVLIGYKEVLDITSLSLISSFPGELKTGDFPLYIFVTKREFTSNPVLNENYFLGSFSELTLLVCELLFEDISLRSKLFIASTFYIHNTSFKYSNSINENFKMICNSIGAPNIKMTINEKNYSNTIKSIPTKENLLQVYIYIKYLLYKVCGQDALFTDFVFCDDSRIYIYKFNFDIFELSQASKSYCKEILPCLDFIVGSFIENNQMNEKYLELNRELASSNYGASHLSDRLFKCESEYVERGFAQFNALIQESTNHI